MNDLRYLNRLFKEYFKEKRNNIHLVEEFRKREFGFIPWDSQTRMIRHMGFTNKENLLKYLLNWFINIWFDSTHFPPDA